MATMKDIITSPLLLAMVIIGLLYIVGFSLVYLKKAYTHCLELGISKEDLKKCHQIQSGLFHCPKPVYRCRAVCTDFGTRNSLELVAPFRYRLTFL